MANVTINQFNSGSISDTSLGVIGDPNTGTLTQTSYHAMKDYFLSGITGSNVNTGSLATTASFNAFTSSYSIDSGSFNLQIANVYASESNYLYTSSYTVDSASFNTRINSITGSGGTLNTGSLLLTSSFNAYTASTVIQISNVYASESNYTLTSSFVTFSSSYHTDSSSFLNLINSITGSGGGVSTGIFQTYTASTNVQIANIYASESLYTLTSSFIGLSGSYSSDSASFNTRINNITGSGGSETVTSIGWVVPISGGSFPVSGSNTYTNSAISGARSVIIFRNRLKDPPFNPGDGSSYYTFSGSTATFVPGLSTGELIDITILS